MAVVFNSRNTMSRSWEQMFWGAYVVSSSWASYEVRTMVRSAGKCSTVSCSWGVGMDSSAGRL